MDSRQNSRIIFSEELSSIKQENPFHEETPNHIEEQLQDLLDEAGVITYLKILKNHCEEKGIPNEIEVKIIKSINFLEKSSEKKLISDINQTILNAKDIHIQASVSLQKPTKIPNKKATKQNFPKIGETILMTNNKNQFQLKKHSIQVNKLKLVSALVQVFNDNVFIESKYQNWSDLELEIFKIVLNKNFKSSKNLDCMFNKNEQIRLVDKVNTNTSYMSILVRDILTQIVKFFNISEERPKGIIKRVIDKAEISIEKKREVYSIVLECFTVSNRFLVQYKSGMRIKNEKLKTLCTFFSAIPEIQLIMAKVRALYFEDQNFIHSINKKMKKKFSKAMDKIVEIINKSEYDWDFNKCTKEDWEMIEKCVPSHRSVMFWMKVFKKVMFWVKVDFWGFFKE